MLNLIETQKLITLRANLRWKLLHYMYCETYPYEENKFVLLSNLNSMGLMFIENCDNLKQEAEAAINYLLHISIHVRLVNHSIYEQLIITPAGVQALERNFNSQGII